MQFPSKTPSLIKRLFPNYVWDFSSNSKTIYLTFDDGPTPEVTSWVLKKLREFNAKATFFCIGNNIKKHPKIYHQILTDKHAIGNHTFNHIKGWRTPNKKYLEEVKACEIVLAEEKKLANEIQNTNLKLFRPPYGQISPIQGRKLLQKKYTIIMWDVIAFDWDNSISSEKCLKNIIQNTQNGSIVVLHDSVKASKHLYYILPKVLEYFTENGFKFKAIM